MKLLSSLSHLQQNKNNTSQILSTFFIRNGFKVLLQRQQHPPVSLSIRNCFFNKGINNNKKSSTVSVIANIVNNINNDDISTSSLSDYYDYNRVEINDHKYNNNIYVNNIYINNYCDNNFFLSDNNNSKDNNNSENEYSNNTSSNQMKLRNNYYYSLIDKDNHSKVSIFSSPLRNQYLHLKQQQHQQQQHHSIFSSSLIILRKISVGWEQSIRKCHTNLTLKDYKDIYETTKNKFRSKKLPKDVNPHGVFACNELDLKEVDVYGFDYDYTLAHYKPSLNYLLYNLGRDIIIERYKYPKEISKLDYIPGFAIRGLHYDIEKGLLLKLDSFLQIQLGSVYRGLTKIPDSEVLKIYKNRIIPIAYVEGHSKIQHDVKSKMIQLADLFSVPEICLLCNIAEYFEKHHIDYHPEILFYDVRNSVQVCHPIMHKIVSKNTKDYIETNLDLVKFFSRLRKAGKKLFLVTNSPFHFVDKGMRLLAGNDWKDFFDIIIVQARKPKFFTDESRPIRLYDEKAQSLLWDRVLKVEKGKIYCEGTVKQLQDLTDWRGHSVLYFGDHPYSDLADVTLEHGWRTGAIISELTHEINTLNNKEFKMNANWLQMLTQLIEDYQDHQSDAAKLILKEWMKERDDLRNETKYVFNEQFGSVFRTYHNPTYFSRRLFRFADVYTSSITNLLEYSVSHTFYPRRGVMPHEYISYFM